MMDTKKVLTGQQQCSTLIRVSKAGCNGPLHVIIFSALPSPTGSTATCLFRPLLPLPCCCWAPANPSRPSALQADQAASLQQLRQMLQSLSEPSYTMYEGRMLHARTEMLGKQRAALLGQTLDMLLHQVARMHEEQMLDARMEMNPR